MAETEIQQRIRSVCSEIADMLVEKNKSYGNSFAEPINIFSKSSAREQLAVRVDDKINRVAKGQEFPGDDTVIDLIGYLVLMRVLADDEVYVDDKKEQAA